MRCTDRFLPESDVQFVAAAVERMLLVWHSRPVSQAVHHRTEPDAARWAKPSLQAGCHAVYQATAAYPAHHRALRPAGCKAHCQICGKATGWAYHRQVSVGGFAKQAAMYHGIPLHNARLIRGNLLQSNAAPAPAEQAASSPPNSGKQKYRHWQHIARWRR